MSLKDKFRPFDGTDIPHITLKGELKQRLSEIAKIRHRVHRGPKETTHDGVIDTAKTHFAGLCGEKAFAEYYDAPLRMRSDLVDGDGGDDFTIYYTPADDVLTVDVKTILFRDGDLLVPDRKLDADIFILAEKRFDQVALIGAAAKDEVTEYKLREQKFPEPCYQVLREDLAPLPDPDNVVAVYPDDHPKLQASRG